MNKCGRALKIDKLIINFQKLRHTTVTLNVKAEFIETSTL